MHVFHLGIHLAAYFKTSRALRRIIIKTKKVLKLLPRKQKVLYLPLPIITVILRLVLENRSSVSLETPLDLLVDVFMEL